MGVGSVQVVQCLGQISFQFETGFVFGFTRFISATEVSANSLNFVLVSFFLYFNIFLFYLLCSTNISANQGIAQLELYTWVFIHCTTYGSCLFPNTNVTLLSCPVFLCDRVSTGV